MKVGLSVVPIPVSKRVIVLDTDASTSCSSPTAVNHTVHNGVGMPPSSFWKYGHLAPVNIKLLAVIFLHVYGLRNNHKIFNSIIQFIVVNVMYYFAALKFSAKMLLHNITVLQNAPTIYVLDVVAHIREYWLTLLEIRPIGVKIISARIVHTPVMQLANTAFLTNDISSAVLNGTSHTNIVHRSKTNVNM